MKIKSYIFISYQTTDKQIAGRIRDILAIYGVDSFLAHEDIYVSEEWRLKILEEIRKADIFICLLSKNYYKSHWCIQESGIAIFRSDMTVIPLSVDDSIPQGFISNLQSVRINPETVSIRDLLPGFLSHSVTTGIYLIIEVIGRSGSYRSAEANFSLILPYIHQLTDEQMHNLLERAFENEQIHHAARCAREYMPPLLKSHGHLLHPEKLRFLKKICAQYA